MEVSIREGSAQGRVSPGGPAHGRIIPWEYQSSQPMIESAHGQISP